MVACVRAVPSPDGGVSPHAELTSGSDGNSGTQVTPGQSYIRVRAAWDVTTAHPNLGVDIRADGVTGSCFLLDDVSLSLVRAAGVQ